MNLLPSHLIEIIKLLKYMKSVIQWNNYVIQNGYLFPELVFTWEGMTLKVHHYLSNIIFCIAYSNPFWCHGENVKSFSDMVWTRLERKYVPWKWHESL